MLSNQTFQTKLVIQSNFFKQSQLFNQTYLNKACYPIKLIQTKLVIQSNLFKQSFLFNQTYSNKACYPIKLVRWFSVFNLKPVFIMKMTYFLYVFPFLTWRFSYFLWFQTIEKMTFQFWKMYVTYIEYRVCVGFADSQKLLNHSWIKGNWKWKPPDLEILL